MWRLTRTPLSKPQWHLLFVLAGGAFVLIVGVLVRLSTGFSAADDRVFALEALAAGVLAEFVVFRLILKKKLVLTEKLPIPFLYVWLALCAFVFVMRPFE